MPHKLIGQLFVLLTLLLLALTLFTLLSRHFNANVMPWPWQLCSLERLIHLHHGPSSGRVLADVAAG